MNPMLLLISILLVACIPQPTARPPAFPLPPSKPKVMEFIDSLEQVQS